MENINNDIICEFCKKPISSFHFKRHLRKNHSDNLKTEYDVTKYVFKTINNIDENLYNTIIDEYNRSSVYYIENKYNVTFRLHVDGLGLKKYTISDTCNNKLTKEKRENTNFEKFGVTNVSKSELIKEKKKETFKKNYGVDNIWKTPEYREWWESEMIKKFGKVCLSDLYGNQNSFGWKTTTKLNKKNRIKKLNDGYLVWYKNLTEDDKIEYNKKKTHKVSSFFKSKLEKRIENILFKNNINYKSQYWIGQKSYDFSLGNKKIIEVQGTFWHCDNRIYKENDIIKFNDEPLFVKEVWEKDLFKKKLANKYGYQILYLWEIDINSMNDDEILSIIKNFKNENC